MASKDSIPFDQSHIATYVNPEDPAGSDLVVVSAKDGLKEKETVDGDAEKFYENEELGVIPENSYFDFDDPQQVQEYEMIREASVQELHDLLEGRLGELTPASRKYIEYKLKKSTGG